MMDGLLAQRLKTVVVVHRARGGQPRDHQRDGHREHHHQRADEQHTLARIAQASAPARPEMNDTLGWIYVQRHEHEQGLPFLSAAARRAPGNPIYHYHLGVAYRQTGDRARAREELQRAMASKQPFHDRERAAQALAGL